MANLLYANNAAGTLAAPITNSSTSLTLNAGQAAAFPAPVAPQVFYATLTDAATETLIEIVKVTAVAGNIFSIVRAQDGTSALSWSAGAIVSQRTIALELRGFENAAEGIFSGVPVTPSTTLGIVGTTLADSANPGSVGEFVTATIINLALSSGQTANITSIPLTPGDWDVTGTVEFTGAASTVVSVIFGAISLINANIPPIPSRSVWAPGVNFGTNPDISFVVPGLRVNVSTLTTVFLPCLAAFGSGGLSASGTISARRVR